MPPPDDPTAGLEVAGHLQILAEGTPLDVAFRGRTIEVSIPDVRSALRLRGRLPRARRERAARVRSVLAVLERGGLELRVLVAGREVGRLGPSSRPGRLAAWLGLDPMELKPRALLAAFLRRGSGAGSQMTDDR